MKMEQSNRNTWNNIFKKVICHNTILIGKSRLFSFRTKTVGMKDVTYFKSYTTQCFLIMPKFDSPLAQERSNHFILNC